MISGFQALTQQGLQFLLPLVRRQFIPPDTASLEDVSHGQTIPDEVDDTVRTSVTELERGVNSPEDIIGEADAVSWHTRALCTVDKSSIGGVLRQ